MTRALKVRPYRWLAEYYDELFAPGRVAMEKARRRILPRVLRKTKAACDLACGTGTTALALAQTGIKIYAVDLSPTMCRCAKEKAKRAGLPIHVYRSDMREFRLPETVDLVTCEYDALNHIPKPADLRKVAKSVARALNPGGYFYFDVNNSKGFLRYWTGNVWVETPRVALVMRNGHSREGDKAWCDVEWFIREGKHWRRRRERVEEVSWTEREIRRELRRAGFDQIRAWDATPFFLHNPFMRPGCHTFYLARKRSD